MENVNLEPGAHPFTVTWIDPPETNAISKLPPILSPDPRLWGREDVTIFLLWAQDAFCLEPYDMKKFNLNGRALCLLTKPELVEKAPYAGHVLFNFIQMLMCDANELTNPRFPRNRIVIYEYEDSDSDEYIYV